MSKRIITNATAGVTLPDSVEVGKPITIQVAPEGKYPQFVDDDTAEGGTREVVQILDRQAMDTLVANFEKLKAESEAKGQKYGVLVDADHSSETSTNTAAMAWVTRLYVDDEKGLMAEIEPTSLGAERINGKVYRFVSGAWTLDEDCRPETLVSIGLTNKPNLPVGAIVNASQVGEVKSTAGVANDDVTLDKPNDTATKSDDDNGEPNGDPEPPPGAVANDNDNNINPDTQEGVISMNLKEKLGLPEEATDVEVEQAVDALIERCAGMDAVQNALGLDETATNEQVVEAINAVIENCGTLQAQNEAAEQEKLKGEADALIAENDDVLPEEIREEVKEEYLEDPEAAKATVANYRRIFERAVINHAKETVVAERKATVIKNSTAKKPTDVGGISAVFNSCKGDAAAINAKLIEMAKKN